MRRGRLTWKTSPPMSLLTRVQFIMDGLLRRLKLVTTFCLIMSQLPIVDLSWSHAATPVKHPIRKWFHFIRLTCIQLGYHLHRWRRCLCPFGTVCLLFHFIKRENLRHLYLLLTLNVHEAADLVACWACKISGAWKIYLFIPLANKYWAHRMSAWLVMIYDDLAACAFLLLTSHTLPRLLCHETVR